MATETTKRPDIEGSIDTTAVRVTFTFADGAADIDITPSDLSADVRQHAMLHGLKQKIGDAAAISRDPETGRSATLADKRAAMQKVVDRLLAGEWNAPRAESTGGLLVQALVKHTGKAKPEVETWVAGKTKAEQAALRRNPAIAKIIADIQAAKADSSIDTDAMLGELGE